MATAGIKQILCPPANYPGTLVDWNRIGDESRYRILNRDRLNAAKQTYHEEQPYCAVGAPWA